MSLNISSTLTDGRVNMSVKPIMINIREPYKTNESRGKTSKRILINSEKNIENTKKQNLSLIKKIGTFLSTISRAFAKILQPRKSRYKSQLEVFESSTKYFILIGNYLGLFPILRKKPKERYQLLSWRYAFSFIICLAQFVGTIFCFIAILKTSLNIRTFSFISFYGTTCLSSILLMRLGTRWHDLLKQIEAANLNEYFDPYVQLKSNIATLVFLSFAVLDHVLSNIPKYLAVVDCISHKDSVYEHYILRSYFWVFEIGLPYNLPIGIILPYRFFVIRFITLILMLPCIYLIHSLIRVTQDLVLLLLNISLQILNLIVAVNWSYCHIFVICVSLYLSSIIKQINKKMLSSEGKYFSASYWRALRQDYCRATKLVRSFDAIINSIVFASFASNLFFVCVQVYYVLRNDTKANHNSLVCTDGDPTKPYHAYLPIFESMYFMYSSAFVIIRTFIVSIIAAEVHSASLEVAPILYSVPSSAYCIEVQRFIEQIHGDRVALTGLNFFYVTKELVLSMVGTIITYELVLLQLD